MPRSTVQEPSFILGREEWVDLPDLGLTGVLAKIDTGAASSTLDARDIVVEDVDGRRRVAFTLPGPAGNATARRCTLPLVARRWVTSSNGQRALRCLISTTIAVGGRQWPIELTLADRGAMRYRMLLGQRAIQDDMIVVPGRARVHGDRLVDAGGHGQAAHRPAPLSIGLIAARPFGRSWQPLADAALQAGHRIVRIALSDCAISLATAPATLLHDGHPAAVLDAAVIEPDAASPTFGLAVHRLLEDLGTVTQNSSARTVVALDPFQTAEALRAQGIPLASNVLQPDMALNADVITHSRCLIVEGKVAAVTASGSRGLPVTRQARALAIRAARALDLRLATVTLIDASGSVAVAALSPSPAFDHFENADNLISARLLIKALAQRAATRANAAAMPPA